MRILSLIVDGSTGYSQAGSSLALSLDAAGADVTCRYLRLHGGADSASLKKLLAKRHGQDYDVCLQVMLPHQMRKLGNLPTYAYFFWETSHFKGSSWARHLNRLDGVIVPDESQRQACLRSGVTVPIFVIPVPCDVQKYETYHKPLEALSSLKDVFKFYSIGEFVKRKNWNNLLTAYFLEFSRGEAVHFVIKTHKSGVGQQELQREFSGWLEKLFYSLKIHCNFDRYPPVSLIDTALTDDEILSLHASCDCFATASFGEGWGLPLADSIGMGKTPVFPVYLKHMDESVGYPFECHEAPCVGVIDSFADLYRADESWFQPDIASLRQAMRRAYSDSESNRQVKTQAGLERAYRFSYEEVGSKLLERLKNGQEVALDRIT